MLGEFLSKTALFLREDCMRSLTMKCLFLGLAVLLMAPTPAAAQSTPGTLGAGVSFLSDDGTATGVTVDYAKPFRSLGNNRTLSWVGDFSWHRKSFDDDLFDVDANATLLSFMGGVRIGGPLGQNENLRWHGQGLVGIVRSSVGGDDIDELCDLADELTDADCSETSFVFSPGGGIDYSFNERTAFRAQLALLLGDDISAVRIWFGIARQLGQ